MVAMAQQANKHKQAKDQTKRDHMEMGQGGMDILKVHFRF
jgi:hypothetical protein